MNSSKPARFSAITSSGETPAPACDSKGALNMPTNVAPQQTQQQPSTQPLVVPLDRIVETVREDARREAERYLDEVVVPKEAGE
jgi:hypothetical protein